MGSLSYEEQRLQNMRDNEALLRSLGLDAPIIARPAPKPRPKPKRENGGDVSLRRSRRTSRGKPSYAIARRRNVKSDSESEAAESHSGAGDSDSDQDFGSDSDSETGRKRKYTSRGRKSLNPTRRHVDSPQRLQSRLGVRTQDPQQFGSIPGVPVGRWWESRMACSTDAIHAPVVAGISGNANVGAWSVALSGGYPDDVDLGEAFTYTGCGGRDLKGTKNNPKNLRTAPQTSHQTFDHRYNAALKKSAETGKPVRVIRGFKLEGQYAPAEGYRYDGLYRVERAWMARGLTKGLMVCRYAFRRLPGQPPLPVRGEEEESDDGEDGTDDLGDEVDHAQEEHEAHDSTERREDNSVKGMKERGKRGHALRNKAKDTADDEDEEEVAQEKPEVWPSEGEEEVESLVADEFEESENSVSAHREGENGVAENDDDDEDEDMFGDKTRTTAMKGNKPSSTPTSSRRRPKHSLDAGEQESRRSKRLKIQKEAASGNNPMRPTRSTRIAAKKPETDPKSTSKRNGKSQSMSTAKSKAKSKGGSKPGPDEIDKTQAPLIRLVSGSPPQQSVVVTIRNRVRRRAYSVISTLPS